MPPNLTNILQPLDVAVNRSFQAYYQTLYDSYIGRAIDDPTLQTKAGNPKVPGYLMVSNWIIEWIATKNSDQIINSFKVCGLLPKENFALEHLHPPLKALFLPTFDIIIWNELYAAEYVVKENAWQIDVYEPPPSGIYLNYVEEPVFICVWLVKNMVLMRTGKATKAS